jgi:hypothetical protein
LTVQAVALNNRYKPYCRAKFRNLKNEFGLRVQPVEITIATLLASPTFHADYAAARAELRKVLGLP